MTPPDKPAFLCTTCGKVICDECAGIAAEHEYLLSQRTAYLLRTEGENELLKRQVADLQRAVELWQSVAKTGLPIILQKWIDDQIQKARRSGKSKAKRAMKRVGLVERYDHQA